MIFGKLFYYLGVTKKARSLKNHIKIAHSILKEMIDKQLNMIKKGESS